VNVAAFTTLVPVFVKTTLPLENETEREQVPLALPVVEVDFADVADEEVADFAVVVVDFAEVDEVVEDFALVEVVADFALVEAAAEPEPDAAQFDCIEHWHCEASAHVGVLILPVLHATCL